MALPVLDLPVLRDAIDGSADPLSTRARMARLLEAHAFLADEIADDALLRDALIAVVAASHSSFALLEHDELAVSMLRGDALQGTVDYGDEARALPGRDEPARELRRWKRRHVVRIAGRDLLGLADLRAVGAELAALARACLGCAVDIAGPAEPFAVIGMGKLGGAELNYASDVDVVFVHEGDQAGAEATARRVLATMSAPSADGFVFRTDANLRPEGRSGALSRTLDAYEAYWSKWAQTWELQALIKADAVAGDAELGGAFGARSRQYVWPEHLDPDAVREVRAMKARSEALLRRKGGADREVKRGPGGIRDIEFAVQLLQLVHGRADPSIRSRNTLDALEQLAAGGYVSTHDAGRLDAAYVWLRTVEHRLQLVDEHQTHAIPTDGAARTQLARVMGFRDRLGEAALDAFDTEHQRQQAVVRTIHEKLFFAPLLDTLAGAGRLSTTATETRLVAFGFRDVEQTRAALQELTAGLTRRSRVMQQLLPVILEWLSVAPDPDLGLLQLRRLTEGYTRSSMLARRFRESPLAAERTCRLLGSSRVLGLAMHRQPEFVDALVDDDILARSRGRDALVEEALDTLDWREDDVARRAGLRRFKRRHLLRIGARDVLDFAPVHDIGEELSNLADACTEAALQSLEPALRFAVIGAGRLGGCELSYASDIDVLFVFDGRGPRAFADAERIATELIRAIGETTGEGQTFRIDARLRPEGRQGMLARSLAGYENYWQTRAEVWEFQALTKARFVAGDRELGERFIEAAHRHVYRDPFPEEWRREIRRMKARIERERIPPGEDPRFHLKLGRGSLSDIEFTIQLEQLAHGGRDGKVREPMTMRALDALTHLGAFTEEDAGRLVESYRLCERARNCRYLLTGAASDALPLDDEAERLGRMLGYLHRPQQTLREEYRRVTRRARDVVERIFYGRT
jgi:glutamate-ammonia-ligase adenylyltransferase